MNITVKQLSSSQVQDQKNFMRHFQQHITDVMMTFIFSWSMSVTKFCFMICKPWACSLAIQLLTMKRRPTVHFNIDKRTVMKIYETRDSFMKCHFEEINWWPSKTWVYSSFAFKIKFTY